MITLLDVNVLIALLDGAHQYHGAAHDWFAVHSTEGWATCAITINGCVRVTTGSGYPNLKVTPAEVLMELSRLAGGPNHRHWDCTVRLTDVTLFRWSIMSSGQLTDLYLLGLAVRNGGRLATFDRKIPLEAVAGATRDHLVVL